MGGGNAQKSATARAKKAASAGKAGGGSNLKQQQSAQNIKCWTCYSTFMCTTKLPELKQHVENKHPGKKFEECFKDYDPNSAANAMSDKTKALKQGKGNGKKGKK